MLDVAFFFFNNPPVTQMGMSISRLEMPWKEMVKEISWTTLYLLQ